VNDPLGPPALSLTRRHVLSAQTTLHNVRELLDHWYDSHSENRRQLAVTAGHALDDAAHDLYCARQALLRELRRYDEELLAELEAQAESDLNRRIKQADGGQLDLLGDDPETGTVCYYHHEGPCPQIGGGE
jgi:hypothetical protein